MWKTGKHEIAQIKSIIKLKHFQENLETERVTWNNITVEFKGDNLENDINNRNLNKLFCIVSLLTLKMLQLQIITKILPINFHVVHIWMNFS